MSRAVAAWFTSLLLVLFLVGLAACSPEASRTRGDGPGADPGNHGAVIQLHGTPEPFYQTPLKGAGR